MTTPTAARSGFLTRRQALRALGAGGVTLAVAGSGALGYRVHDTAAFGAAEGEAFAAWDQWKNTPGLLGAVSAAVLAASPHNTQPWIFAIKDDRVDVLLDSTRNTGTVDPFDRELHMGIGCALENLALGCEARRLTPRITLLPEGPTSSIMARVDTQLSTSRAGSALYDAIGDRHTNRGPFQIRAIPKTTLENLVSFDNLRGLQLNWITKAESRACLSSLLVDAAAELVRDERQSKDNFAWFRPDKDAIDRHLDGLTLNGQGFSPLVLAMAKLLPASSREQGDQFWFKQTKTVHTATAAAYGVITTTTPNERSTQIEAGRLLQRIHLAATSQGIALHHMNQITERIDRERTTGIPSELAPRFADLLPRGQTPLLTFRVGYPERPAKPSPRRPASEVIR